MMLAEQTDWLRELKDIGGWSAFTLVVIFGGKWAVDKLTSGFSELSKAVNEAKDAFEKKIDQVGEKTDRIGQAVKELRDEMLRNRSGPSGM